MIVWRDLETGPVYPSIGSAPSIGTLGMSFSVTTFMKSLLGLTGFKVSEYRNCSGAGSRRVRGDRHLAPACRVKWRGMEGAGICHGAKKRTFRLVRMPS